MIKQLSNFSTFCFYVSLFTLARLEEPARAAELPGPHMIEPLIAQADCSKAVPVNRTDKATLEAALQSNGLIGYVHGFVGSGNETPPSGTTIPVFTVRSSSNFFDAVQVNLLPVTQDSKAFFSQVGRHDKICIKGAFASFGGAQLHAQVSSAGLMAKYENRYENLPPYEYRGPSVEELPQSGKVSARVHAIADGALILEVVDRIAPLVVSNKNLIPSDLFRFDIVNVSYLKESAPGRPNHLVLDEAANSPLRITQRIKDIDGQAIKLTGKLALFPKSPQISQDTYALKVEEFGFETNYTLVNFEDAELFEKIRSKLAEIWAEEVSTVERSRNSFFNPNIILTVEGKANVQSPAQANPQVILSSLDKIKREK